MVAVLLVLILGVITLINLETDHLPENRPNIKPFYDRSQRAVLFYFRQ